MARPVKVILDKERRLRYDINAFSDIEEELGVTVGEAIQNVGIRTLRALMWAGLKWEERGLTVERTGDIIERYIEEGGDMETLTATMRKGLEASGLFKIAEGTEEDDENPTA